MQDLPDLDDALLGKRILVVEDRYLLADEIRRYLAEAGAEVLGPAATHDDAVSIFRTQRVDAALLDIDLRGEHIFAFADKLAEAGIPYVFATGFDSSVLPEAHANARFLRKPLSARAVVTALTQALGAAQQKESS